MRQADQTNASIEYIENDEIDVITYPLFQADQEIDSIQQLYQLIKDIIDEKITTKVALKILYKFRDKIMKNDEMLNALNIELQKWLKIFIVETSGKYAENLLMNDILSEFFYILFQANDEADSCFIYLMDYSLECCTIAIRIFGYYIRKKLVLEPFYRVIRKIIKYLQNIDLRRICLSVIRESLTNSHYLYESLTPDHPLIFLSVSDDPTSISNGLEICKQMVEAPPLKFPPNGYEFFFHEVLKAIIFFAQEKIISDIIILQITEISLLFKTIDFFYLMDPNEFLFAWISSIFNISERFLNQEQALSSKLDDYLIIVNNLIKFWLLPPNLLKIQSTPEFNKFKEDFVSLCMSFFLKHSNNKKMKIIIQIMEDTTFCNYLGQYFSSVHTFKNIFRHQIKNYHRNIGNCVLISIFASILKEREFSINDKPFKKSDFHRFNEVIDYYVKFPLEKPETDEDFLFGDAFSRVLFSFSNTYLKKGKIDQYYYDKIIQNISVLYFRTLVNLQSDDQSKERLSRNIDSILSIPFEIIETLSKKPEFNLVVSNLKFKFIEHYRYKKEVKSLYDHLFSIHDDNLNKALLDFAYPTDKISPNIFVIIRSFIQNCIDENQYRVMQIVIPLIQKALESQKYLGEVAETIEAISYKVFPQKSASMSPEIIDYVKMIISMVHLLLGQFISAEPNEEEIIACKVLNTFNNLLVYQPINFGFLVFYNDYCFHQIIEEFFSLLYTKDIGFFCQDSDFVISLIQFLDSFIDAELVHDKLFNNLHVLFIQIFDLHQFGNDMLLKLSEIMIKLIGKGFKLDESLLQCILKYKISIDPTLSIFNKLVILLCRVYYGVFFDNLKGKENLLSDDANELIQYIFSELSSENFEYTTQFETDFWDFFEMIKNVLLSSLFIENKNLEAEEDIQP